MKFGLGKLFAFLGAFLPKLSRAVGGITSKLGNQLDKTRRALGPVEGVLTIVIVGALLAVAPFVIGALQNGLNTSGLPGAADNSIGNVFTQIYNSLGILPLVLIILALVVILSAIFLLVPRRGGAAVGGEAV